MDEAGELRDGGAHPEQDEQTPDDLPPAVVGADDARHAVRVALRPQLPDQRQRRLADGQAVVLPVTHLHNHQQPTVTHTASTRFTTSPCFASIMTLTPLLNDPPRVDKLTHLTTRGVAAHAHISTWQC